MIGSYRGCVGNLDELWKVDDMPNAMMGNLNLISVIALSGERVDENRAYRWNDELDADDESLEEVGEE